TCWTRTANRSSARSSACGKVRTGSAKAAAAGFPKRACGTSRPPHAASSARATGTESTEEPPNSYRSPDRESTRGAVSVKFSRPLPTKWGGQGWGPGAELYPLSGPDYGDHAHDQPDHDHRRPDPE